MSNFDTNDYKQILELVNRQMPKLGEANLRGDKLVKKSKEFFASLGNPQNNYKVVHIAGTMGKGTVAYMIESILRAHGFKTGMTISPHVFTMRERIQTNGVMITKQDYVRLVKHVEHATRGRVPIEGKMTYYEANVLVASLLFNEKNVDYAVLETGLGGLYDMTNIFNPINKMAVVIKIGLDHVAVLGDTIEEIATQKAGIFQPGNLAICFNQANEVISVFKKVAEEKNTRLSIIESDDNIVGRYHQNNLNLAIEACKLLAARDGWHYDQNLADQAIGSLVIPGKAQKITINNKQYIFDGAHNPDKADGLTRILLQEKSDAKFTIIMALKKSKDAKGVIEALAPIANRFIFTTFLASQDISSMSHEPVELAQIASDLGIESKVTDNAQQALKLTIEEKDLVLVTGSNYLLGDVFDLASATCD